VVIIGGGAAGTAVFLALVRHRGAEFVDVVDPRPPGLGAVFDTGDAGLLCNTSAGVMSLDPANPDGFVEYLRQRGVPAERDDFVPRDLVAGYCADSYRRHAMLAARRGIAHRHIPSRAPRVTRRGSGYRVDLAGGGQLSADDVVVATGTGPPVVPTLVRRHLGRPGLFETVDPVRLNALAPGSSVLVLGSRLSAIDATLLLCGRGHRVAMTSRSGLLPAVRTRLGAGTPLDRAALAGLDLTDPALPLAVVRLVRRAVGRPLRDQVSTAADPVTRLREEITLARSGTIGWQDVIAELIEWTNTRLSTVDSAVRRTAMSRCATLISRYISAFPLRNAERLLAAIDGGAATLHRPQPSHIEPDGRGGWTVWWRHGTRSRYDAVVCATGFHPPALSCRQHELRLDIPATHRLMEPRVDADLRMRFPRGTSPERIWLLGTTSYLRTPIVNYLRTAADHADMIARSIAVSGARAEAG
jgi:uncharacterized NAD(P)/FAD-binding protein YdhS